MADINAQDVLTAISDVREPGLNKSLVSAMLIRDVEVKKGVVSLTLVMITPAHPFREKIENEIRDKITEIEGVKKVKLTTVVEVPADNSLRAGAQIMIKNVIAVASGKGGVGKSTIAVNIAVALAQAGAKVGLMDADLYGPNVPLMMGVSALPKPIPNNNNIPPAEAYGVKLISIGFMVRPDQPIIWRGPMLDTAIKQFVQDVEWGEIDYLIVDLPPGTGDAQLSLAQSISATGILIVTMPQQVSLDDARRGLEMFRELKVPIFGIVENMSYLELPDGQMIDVFGSGGGEKLAKEAGVGFIGAVPLDPAVREGGDAGTPIVVSHPDSKAAQAMQAIAADVSLKASVLAIRNKSQSIPINIIN